MDNVTIMDTILEKKLDNYKAGEVNNFVCESELTVNITVNEYRELIKRDATAEYRINEANAGKYDRERKITELENQVKELREKIYDLQDKLSTYEGSRDMKRTEPWEGV